MIFRRRFKHIEILRDEARRRGWLQDLLRAWAPAGNSLSEDRPLRLSLGDNTLKFYHYGQRVALVWVGREITGTNSLKLAIDNKYVVPEAKLDNIRAVVVGQDIVCHGVDGKYKKAYSRDDLLCWVERAAMYRKAEKEAVERNATAFSAGVLDYEMNIPGTGGQIDLVALDETNEGHIRVCFWEAKAADSRDLRSLGDPSVVAQLDRYHVALIDNSVDVRDAYVEASKTISELHSIASSISETPMPSLGGLIGRVAAGEALQVNALPHLLVVPKIGERPRPGDRGYRNKIREAGYPVLFADQSEVELSFDASRRAKIAER